MKKWWLLLIFLVVLSVFSIAQTVSTSDLKATLIDAIKSYFTSTPKVTLPELKDLLYAYFSTTGITVDLSKTGTYSGEKLETIYYKVKGVPKWPDPNAPLGSKNNPVKLDQDFSSSSARGLHFYGYEWCESATGGLSCYYLPSGKKVYFLIDPIAFTGKSCRGFISEICWGCNNENLRFYMIIRDKKTGRETDEKDYFYSYSARDTFYNNILPYYLNNSVIPKESKIDDLQFLYAVDNIIGGIPRDEEMMVFWQGCFPSCEELGGVCKENCYKYNDCDAIATIEPCDDLYNNRCCRGSCTAKS